MSIPSLWDTLYAMYGTSNILKYSILKEVTGICKHFVFSPATSEICPFVADRDLSRYCSGCTPHTPMSYLLLFCFRNVQTRAVCIHPRN